MSCTGPGADPDPAELETRLRQQALLAEIGRRALTGGLSGVDLVRAARLRRPGLKAVLTSGYLTGELPGASDAVEIAAADLPLLSKPYRQDDLARVIAAALRSGSR